MKKLAVALIGNPNCGKSTLFNALTGAQQKVGNWPGVTVERKSGFFIEADTTIQVIDLPGLYSLTLAAESGAVDERIASEFILQREADLYINIVDASHLERHLYLTTQLREMGVPMILALNMMDVARARKIQIDVAAIQRELNCPVVVMEARKGNGVRALKQAIADFDIRHVAAKTLPYPEVLQQAIYQVASSRGLTAGSRQPSIFLDPAVKPRDDGTAHLQSNAFHTAIRLLEDDAAAWRNVPDDIASAVESQQAIIQQTLHEDADILIADTRYRYIQSLLQQCVSVADTTQTTWTARIDKIVLNRVLGIPIFLAAIYLLFLFSINVGGALQDFFDLSSQTIFVDGVSNALTRVGAPTWLIALLANGAGKGINTVITFVPVIGALFLFLSLLEDSGYMARAAFVVDRFMRMLGLPGKAFVPMIVGFGCNVPAVMAARTLENKRDRIITILMTPFMSCGARLAIYAIFTAAFFPHGGQNIVFALYLIGIAMAVLTGFILRHSLLKGDPAPLVMELPAYHVPQPRALLLHAWQRLKGFVFRAGKLIVPVCVIIGALNALHIDGTLNSGEGDMHSLLSIAGQWLTPAFAPMGIHADNWPATVGLLTGVLAKEVVVGTLNTLYTQMGHLAMYQQFDGKIGAFAYLLFVLLYFPCVSTMAVMLRELHRGWAVFSAFWSTAVAYAVAVIFYQAATCLRHPLTSCAWIAAMLFLFFGTLIVMRKFAERREYAAPAFVTPVGETA